MGASLLVVVGTATLILGTTPHAAPVTPPIPKAGLLARPKSLEQVGIPRDATHAAIPPDNPENPAKIALGERLFFDGRLSADGTVACSTCHDPARAFTDGRPTSIGIEGRVGQRNAPTILNALYNKTQFWDGRVKTLEEQAALPIVKSDRDGAAQPGRCRGPDRGHRGIPGRLSVRVRSPAQRARPAARLRADAGVVWFALRSLHRRRREGHR